MPDYKAMYFMLFNRITDAIDILQQAQREGEKTYMESEDAIIHILPTDDEEDEEKE